MPVSQPLPWACTALVCAPCWIRSPRWAGVCALTHLFQRCQLLHQRLVVDCVGEEQGGGTWVLPQRRLYGVLHCPL